jgi:hypothetical protein
MRFGVAVVLVAACVVAGCAKGLATDGAASERAAGDGMVVQLKTKDGNALDIHLPPPNGKPTDVKGVDELFQTFTTFCLEAFPNDDAVAAKVKAGAHEPLTAEDLAEVLHGESGEGWVVRLNHSAITLTVQHSASHACGARAFLPAEPDIGITAATYIGLWGFTQSPPETFLPGRVTADGPQTVESFTLAGPDKRPVEEIAAYFTHDPNSQQVELRLVRIRKGDR